MSTVYSIAIDSVVSKHGPNVVIDRVRWPELPWEVANKSYCDFIGGAGFTYVTPMHRDDLAMQIYVDDADLTHTGVVTLTDQTFGGNKTFAGDVYVLNTTASFATSVVTLAYFEQRIGTSGLQCVAPLSRTLTSDPVILSVATAAGTTAGVISGVAQTLGGDLTLSGNTKVDGPSTFAGNATFTGSNDFSSANTFTGDITFTGDTLVGGPVTVAGDSVFTGKSTFTNTAEFTGSVTVGGNALLTGNNTLTGANTFTGSNDFSAANTFTGDLTFTGDTLVGGPVTVAGDSVFTGKSTFSNTAEFTGNVTVGGNALLTGTNTFTGANTFTGSNDFSAANTFTGDITFTGDTLVGGPVTVAGDSVFTGKSTFSNTAEFTGSVTVGGNALLTGNNTFTGANTFTGSNDFSAPNTFTGSITLTGNTHVEGPITTSGASLFTGTANFASSATMQGNALFKGTNTHSGVETFTNSIYVPTGAWTAPSTLAANGDYVRQATLGAGFDGNNGWISGCLLSQTGALTYQVGGGSYRYTKFAESLVGAAVIPQCGPIITHAAFPIKTVDPIFYPAEGKSNVVGIYIANEIVGGEVGEIYELGGVSQTQFLYGDYIQVGALVLVTAGGVTAIASVANVKLPYADRNAITSSELATLLCPINLGPNTIAVGDIPSTDLSLKMGAGGLIWEYGANAVYSPQNRNTVALAAWDSRVNFVYRVWQDDTGSMRTELPAAQYIDTTRFNPGATGTIPSAVSAGMWYNSPILYNPSAHIFLQQLPTDEYIDQPNAAAAAHAFVRMYANGSARYLVCLGVVTYEANATDLSAATLSAGEYFNYVAAGGSGGGGAAGGGGGAALVLEKYTGWLQAQPCTTTGVLEYISNPYGFYAQAASDASNVAAENTPILIHLTAGRHVGTGSDLELKPYVSIAGFALSSTYFDVNGFFVPDPIKTPTANKSRISIRNVRMVDGGVNFDLFACGGDGTGMETTFDIYDCEVDWAVTLTGRRYAPAPGPDDSGDSFRMTCVMLHDSATVDGGNFIFNNVFFNDPVGTLTLQSTNCRLGGFVIGCLLRDTTIYGVANSSHDAFVTLSSCYFQDASILTIQCVDNTFTGNLWINIDRASIPQPASARLQYDRTDPRIHVVVYDEEDAQSQVIYMSATGDDTRSGVNLNNAVLTLPIAFARCTEGGASVAKPYVVEVVDARILDSAHVCTVPANCSVHAPSSTMLAQMDVASGSRLQFKAIAQGQINFYHATSPSDAPNYLYVDSITPGVVLYVEQSQPDIHVSFGMVRMTDANTYFAGPSAGTKMYLSGDSVTGRIAANGAGAFVDVSGVRDLRNATFQTTDGGVIRYGPNFGPEAMQTGLLKGTSSGVLQTALAHVDFDYGGYAAYATPQLFVATSAAYFEYNGGASDACTLPATATLQTGYAYTAYNSSANRLVLKDSIGSAVSTIPGMSIAHVAWDGAAWQTNITPAQVGDVVAFHNRTVDATKKVAMTVGSSGDFTVAADGANVQFASGNVVSVLNAGDSASAASGAGVVAGGLGVGRSIYAGDRITGAALSTADTAAGAAFRLSGRYSLAAEYALGATSTAATIAAGTVQVTNGKIRLTGAVPQVYWANSASIDGLAVGTIRFKFTPEYNTKPSNDVYMIELRNASDALDKLAIGHLASTGQIYAQVWDHAAFVICNTNVGTYVARSGVEAEFLISWDLTVADGAECCKVWVDGAQLVAAPAVRIAGGTTRTAATTRIFCGGLGSATARSIRDVCIWPTRTSLWASAAVPVGYSAYASADVQNARVTEVFQVLNATDPAATSAKSLTVTVDASGTALFDTSGNAVKFANTEVVSVLNPADATTATAGSFVSYGGVGAKRNVVADAYVIGGAVGVSDLVTGATFKCSGRYQFNAEYTLANGGGDATANSSILSNGKLACPGTGSNVIWPLDSKCYGMTAGSLRIKWTHGSTTNPFLLFTTPIKHLIFNDGTKMTLSCEDDSVVQKLNVTFPLVPVAGTEYEIYATWDLVTLPVTGRLWVNGVELTGTYVTREAAVAPVVTNITAFRVQNNFGAGTFYFGDIAIWKTAIIPNPNPYNPGYAVWPEVGGLELRATGLSDAFSDAPIKSAGGIRAAKSLICGGRAMTTGVRVDPVVNANATLIVEGYKSINADYSTYASGYIPATSGTVAIDPISSKIKVTTSGSISWPIDSSNESIDGLTGAVRFKFTPSWGRAPAANFYPFRLQNGVDTASTIELWWLTNGNIYFYVNNNASTPAQITPPSGAVINSLVAQSGREYEFELNWDLALGVYDLFIDGVKGTTLSGTGTRAPFSSGRVCIAGAANVTCSYRDIMLFKSVQHTASYTPGYSSWSSVDAPRARISGTVEVHNAADWTKKATVAVDASGDATIDVSGNDLFVANSSTVTVLNPVESTSSTTGVLQVRGGIGSNMSVNADGYVTAGAVGVSDLVTGATFKCSGRYLLNAEYTLADGGGIPPWTTAVSVSSGKIRVLGGNSIYWLFDAKTASATVGTWRFKYTPGYDGTPAATAEILQVTDNTYANYSIVQHNATTGTISFLTVSASTMILNATYGVYTAASGKEDEFYVAFDLSAATARVWKNGTELTATYVTQTAGARGAITRLRCNTSVAGFSIRDIAIWNTAIIPNPNPYNPGYAVWPEALAPNLTASGAGDASFAAVKVPSGGIQAAKDIATSSRELAAGVRVAPAAVSGLTFVVEGYKSVNADLTAAGSSVPSSTNAPPTLSNGKITVPPNVLDLTWPIVTAMDGGANGTVRLKMTPNYGGNPVASVYPLILKDASSGFNQIYLAQGVNGVWQLYMLSSTGTVIVNWGSLGSAWNAQAGREYELMFCWSSGSQKLFIDGALWGSLTAAGTRAALSGTSPTYGCRTEGTANFYIRDVMLFTSVQQTASYAPGYASWSALDAPLARIAGNVEVHSATNWAAKTTLSVDTAGSFTVDSGGPSTYFAAGNTVRVLSAAESVSSGTGAMQLLGGMGAKGSVVSDGYVLGGAVGVTDLVTGATFKCSGRYQFNAEYSLADGGVIGSPVNTVTLAGGKIVFAAGGAIAWPADLKTSSTTVGTFRFKYTAGYPGTPSSTHTMFMLAISGAASQVSLYHNSGTGLLQILAKLGGATKLASTFGVYAPLSGVEDEFYVTFDLTVPVARVWKNGIELAATTTTSIAMALPTPELFYINSAVPSSYRDIAVWKTAIIPNPNPYNPGYAVWPEVGAPELRANSTADALSDAPIKSSGGIRANKELMSSERIVGAGLRVNASTLTGRTFIAECYKSIDGDYSTYSPQGLVATPVGTVSNPPTNGKIVLGASSSISWPINSTNDGGAVGAMRLKYTPSYGGYPTALVRFACLIDLVNGGYNRIEVTHETNGAITLYARDSAGTATLYGANLLTGWSVQSGREYEIEYDWDHTGKVFNVFVDGVKGTTLTVTATRTAIPSGVIYLSTGASVAFSIRDFVLFNTVQHTASYAPGYSGIAALDTSLLRIAGSFEIHSATSWAQKATFSVDSAGELSVTPTAAVTRLYSVLRIYSADQSKYVKLEIDNAGYGTLTTVGGATYMSIGSSTTFNVANPTDFSAIGAAAEIVVGGLSVGKKIGAANTISSRADVLASASQLSDPLYSVPYTTYPKLRVSGRYAFDADYSNADGGRAATTAGTVSITAGKIALSSSTASVSWLATSKMVQTLGTWRFKYTPAYNGSPATKPISMMVDVGSTKCINFTHETGGALQVAVGAFDTNGAFVQSNGAIAFGTYTAASGVEDEFMLEFTMTTPTFALWQNGVGLSSTANTLTIVASRADVTGVKTMRNGSGSAYSIRDFAMWSVAVPAGATYVPGYAAWPEMLAPTAYVTGTGDGLGGAAAIRVPSGGIAAAKDITTLGRHVSGGIRAESQTLGTGVTFIFEGYKTKDAVFTADPALGLAGTLASGTVSLQDGRMYLNPGSAVYWPINASLDGGQFGAVRFKFTPQFGKAPQNSVELVTLRNAADLKYAIVLFMATNGNIYESIYDSTGAILTGSSFPLYENFHPEAGREYEIEYDWDLSGGTHNAYVEGVRGNYTQVQTLARVALSASAQIKVVAPAGTSGWGVRDLVLFNAPQHTAATYAIGYSSLAAIDTPLMRLAGDFEIHNASNWAQKATFNVGTSGDLSVTATGTSVSFAQSNVVMVLNPADSTSSTTGALQVVGGIGARRSINSDAYVVGGALGVSDLVTGATFKCSGRYQFDAEYSLADAGNVFTYSGTSAPTISGGKISVPTGTTIRWPAGDKTCSATVNTWRFKYTPGYSGSPTIASVGMMANINVAGTTYFYMEHTVTTGLLKFFCLHGGANKIVASYGSYSPLSGVEDEFYVVMDSSAATARIWKNGVELAASYTVQSAQTLGVRDYMSSYAGSPMSIRDIAVWNTAIVPNPNPYNPGYAVWPEVLAPNLIASGTGDAAVKVPSGGIRAGKDIATLSRETAAGLRVADVPNAALTLAIEGYKSLNADYTSGALGLVPSAQLGASISGGKIVVAAGANYVIWPIDASNDGGLTGAIRWKYTPAYGGMPAATTTIMLLGASNTKSIQLAHGTVVAGGRLRYLIRNNADNAWTVDNDFVVTWLPEAGREYEFEIDWNMNTPGTHNLFIDGVKQTTLSGFDARTAAASSSLKFLAGTGVSFSIRDVMLFNAVQHTASYQPGYAAVSAMDATSARLTGALELHNAIDFNDRADLSLDAATRDIVAPRSGIAAPYGRGTAAAGRIVAASPVGLTFAARGATSLNADYTAGLRGLVATSTGASISGGKIALASGNSTITWPLDGANDGGTTNTVRFRWTPGYDGAPVGVDVPIVLFTSSTGTGSFALLHQAGGLTLFKYFQDTNATKLWDNGAALTAVSGQEYVIELVSVYNIGDTSLTTGYARLFVDGVRHSKLPFSPGSFRSPMPSGILQFGCAANYPFSIRDVMIFRTVVHPETVVSFDPSYSALTAVEEPTWSGVSLVAECNESLDADYTCGAAGLRAAVANVSLSGNGKALIPYNGTIDWPWDATNDGGQVGAIRFKFTPTYGPTAGQNYIIVYVHPQSSPSQIYLSHTTTGVMQLYAWNSSGVSISNGGTIFPYLGVVPGREYEIELNWDFTRGFSNVFVDGLMGTTVTATGTRTLQGSPSTLRFASITSCSYYVRDVMAFTDVQHTASYVPGYVAWTSLDALQMARVQGSVQLRSAGDWSERADLQVDAGTRDVAAPRSGLLATNGRVTGQGLRVDAPTLGSNGASLIVEGYKSLNADYTLGVTGVAPLTVTNATISGGKISVPANGAIYWPWETPNDGGQTGAVKFKWTPAFTGLPAANSTVWIINHAAAVNRVAVTLSSIGDWLIYSNSSTGAAIQSGARLEAGFFAVAGREYEIELDWDYAGGYQALYIDGARGLYSTAVTGTRPVYAGTTDTGFAGIANCPYSVRDFMVFKTVQHTAASYVPGYASFSAAEAPVAKIASSLTVANPLTSQAVGALSFAASGATSLNAEFTAGTSGTAPTTGTSGTYSLTGGKISCGNTSWVAWPKDAAQDGGNTGALRWKMTPGYTGSPATGNGWGVSAAGTAYNLYITHDTAGRLLYWLRKGDDTAWISAATGSQFAALWSPQATREYEFEIDWNLVSGVHDLFIDGVKQTTLTGLTGTRSGGATGVTMTINAASAFRDVLWFKSVQHTASYAPDGLTWASIAGPRATVVGGIDMQLATDATASHVTMQMNTANAVAVSYGDVAVANAAYAGAVRATSSAATGTPTFAATLYKHQNADYSASGVKSGTLGAASAITSTGKLIVGANGYCSWPFTSAIDAATVGCIRFKFTPTWTGYPPAICTIMRVSPAGANEIYLYHDPNGNVYFQFRDSAGAYMVSGQFNLWAPVIGREYELELDFNIGTGQTGSGRYNLFVDGLKLNNIDLVNGTIAGTVTRTALSSFCFGRSSSPNNAQPFYVRDFCWYNAVQHADNYAATGYSAWPNVYAEKALATSGNVEVRNPQDWLKAATLNTGADSVLACDASIRVDRAPSTELQFAAELYNSLNADYTTGTLGLLEINSFASVTNGKARVATTVISWNVDGPMDGGQVGAVRWKYTPSYNTAAAGDVWMMDLANGVNNNWRIALTHASIGGGYNGAIFANGWDGAGNVIAGFGGQPLANTWWPTSGVEYEFEFNWDFASGKQRLFIDGVRTGYELSATAARVAISPGFLRMFITSGVFSVRDIQMYNAVQHTAAYTPGYVAWKSIDVPSVRSGNFEIRNAVNWFNGCAATMSVDTLGTMTVSAPKTYFSRSVAAGGDVTVAGLAVLPTTPAAGAVVFAVSGKLSTSANYQVVPNAGPMAGSIVGSVAVSGGKIALTSGASIFWVLGTGRDSALYTPNSHAVKFKYTPGYSGMPAVETYMYLTSSYYPGSPPNYSACGLVQISHQSNGQLRVYVRDWSNTIAGNWTTVYNWSPTAGREYEFELDVLTNNGTKGEHSLYIDGNRVWYDNTTMVGYTRGALVVAAGCIADVGTSFSIRDIVMYNARQHNRDSYAPGYSSLAGPEASTIVATSDVTVAQPNDRAKSLALTVDANGVGTMTVPDAVASANFRLACRYNASANYTTATSPDMVTYAGAAAIVNNKLQITSLGTTVAWPADANIDGGRYGTIRMKVTPAYNTAPSATTYFIGYSNMANFVNAMRLSHATTGNWAIDFYDNAGVISDTGTFSSFNCVAGTEYEVLLTWVQGDTNAATCARLFVNGVDKGAINRNTAKGYRTAAAGNIYIGGGTGNTGIFSVRDIVAWPTTASLYLYNNSMSFPTGYQVIPTIDMPKAQLQTEVLQVVNTAGASVKACTILTDAYGDATMNPSGGHIIMTNTGLAVERGVDAGGSVRASAVSAFDSCAAATFRASLYNHQNAEYSASGATASTAFNGTVAGGKTYLASTQYIRWANSSSIDAGSVGCARFKYTPNYSGTPATAARMLQCPDGSANCVRIFHNASTGNLSLIVFSELEALVNSAPFSAGAWSPSAGREYEFELNFDVGNFQTGGGAYRLFIDGNQWGSTLTNSGTASQTRSASAALGFGSTAASQGYYVRDFVWFRTVQHTSDYVSGFSAWPAAWGAKAVVTMGNLEVRDAIDYTKVATMSVDGTGTMALNATQFRVINPADALSKATGAEVVVGGLGVGANAYVGAYAVGGAVRAADQVSFAAGTPTLRVSGNSSLNADFTMANAGGAATVTGVRQNAYVSMPEGRIYVSGTAGAYTSVSWPIDTKVVSLYSGTWRFKYTPKFPGGTDIWTATFGEEGLYMQHTNSNNTLAVRGVVGTNAAFCNYTYPWTCAADVEYEFMVTYAMLSTYPVVRLWIDGRQQGATAVTMNPTTRTTPTKWYTGTTAYPHYARDILVYNAALAPDASANYALSNDTTKLPPNSIYVSGTQMNADTTLASGGATATTAGSVAISGGKIALTAINSTVSWPNDKNTDKLSVGAASFKYTPGFSGAPASPYLELLNLILSGFSNSGLFIRHAPGNVISFAVSNTGGSTTIANATWPFVGVSGTEYNFMVAWDLTVPVGAKCVRLWIDGIEPVSTNNTRNSTDARSTTDTMVVKTGTSTSTFSIRQIRLYPNVAGDYSPGYSANPSVYAPNVVGAGSGDGPTSFATIKAPYGGMTIAKDATTSSRYVSQGLRVEQPTNAAKTFVAEGYQQINADFTAGSLGLTATTGGSLSLVAGKIYLAAGGAIDWPLDATNYPGTIGALKFKYTPNYAGARAAGNNTFVYISDSAGRANIGLWHTTAGAFTVVISNSAGTVLSNTLAGTWMPEATREYEFELDWDFTGGSEAQRLFVDGRLYGAAYVVATHTAAAGASVMSWRSDVAANAFSLRDVVLYTAVQHTADYYPGYASISCINTPALSVAGGSPLTFYTRKQYAFDIEGAYETTGTYPLVLDMLRFEDTIIMSIKSYSFTAIADDDVRSKTALPDGYYSRATGMIWVSDDLTLGVGRVQFNDWGYLTISGTNGLKFVDGTLCGWNPCTFCYHIYPY